MLYKTQGIAIRTYRYSETSVIARIYTLNFGIQSYIINGVRSARPKVNPSLLLPASLLDMVVYHREGKNLQRVAEIKPDRVFTSIPFDTAKSSIALFISELANRTLKEEESNGALFHFLRDAVSTLDLAEHVANYPVWFAIQFTRYLGFFPHGSYAPAKPFFDLKEGAFTQKTPDHPHYFSIPYSEFLSLILNASPSSVHHIRMTRQERGVLLKYVVDYYSLHINSMGPVLSPSIFHEVF